MIEKSCWYEGFRVVVGVDKKNDKGNSRAEKLWSFYLNQ